MTSSSKLRILIDVDGLGSTGAPVLVRAAAQLLAGAPVEVLVCVRGGEPTQSQLDIVTRWVVSAVPDPAMLPTIQLVDAYEARAAKCVMTVVAGDDPATTAAGVGALLSLLTQLQRAGLTPEAERQLAVTARTESVLATARRDVVRAATAGCERRPLVVALFQHRGYWPSVQRLFEALRDRDDVDFRVVNLDSGVDTFARSTAEFLHERGWTSASAQWLIDELDTVDAVLLDNPYDEFRPPQLHVAALARRGVRLVNIPYGNGAIAGDLMDKLLWDMPLQRSAWRTYVSDAAQQRLLAAQCAAGADGVRVLGSPKQDLTLTHVPGAVAARITAAARGRKVVLWNPHFRVEPGGWSTFSQHVTPLLEAVTTARDVLLVVRPHFRLFESLRLVGTPHLEAQLRQAAATSSSVMIDESPDYLDAFAAADALISDLSSLASEFLLTGRPLLYTHRADGPGANDAGAYFASMARADTVEDVRLFLDQVRAGEDPRREQRRAAAARHFPYADGSASTRIAADVVRSLRAELHLTAPAGATAPAVAVSAVALVADGLSVRTGGSGSRAGSAAGAPFAVQLRGADAATAWHPLADGGATVALVQHGGPDAGLPLPPGRYRLHARTGGAGQREAVVDAGAASTGSTSRTSSTTGLVHSVAVDGGAVALDVTGVERPAAGSARASSTRPSKRPALRDAVVFTSYAGRSASCHPAALARELAAQGHEAVRHFVVTDGSVRVPDGCRPLLLGSAAHHEAMATSRWVVDNESIPLTVTKQPGQVFVQTWHGTPLKKLRRDLQDVAPRDPAVLAECERDAARWDFTLSSNPLTTEVFRRAFRAGGTIVEEGSPRNDVLSQPGRTDEAARRVREVLALAPGQPIVLHAPTWRNEDLGGSAADPASALDWEVLRAVIGDDVALLTRRHRFLPAGRTESSAGVLDVTRWPDMAELLAAADVLVTDYSSSFFDFSLTGRPMLFFAPDLERYRSRERGHYFTMEETVPGPVVTTSSDLAREIHSLRLGSGSTATGPSTGTHPRQAAFRSAFTPWDDGEAAKRVVATVFA